MHTPTTFGGGLLSLMNVLVSVVITIPLQILPKVFVHAAGIGDFLKAQKTVEL